MKRRRRGDRDRRDVGRGGGREEGRPGHEGCGIICEERGRGGTGRNTKWSCANVRKGGKQAEGSLREHQASYLQVVMFV